MLYHQQIKYSYLFLKSITELSKAGLAFLFLHSLYFVVNITEVFDIEIEKKIIWFYPVGLVVMLAYWLYSYYRLAKNFDLSFENDFDLGFKWINLVDEKSRQQKNKITKAEIKKILDGKSIFKTIYQSEREWWLSLLGVLLLWGSLPFVWSDGAQEFKHNLRTVFEYSTPDYELRYPVVINKGDRYEVSYLGDYPEVKLVLNYEEEVVLKSGESRVWSNVVVPQVFEYSLQSGRSLASGRFEINILEPPSIQNIQLNVVDQSSEQSQTFEGLYSLQVDKNRQVEMIVDYQSDQVIVHQKVVWVEGKGLVDLNRVKPYQLELKFSMVDFEREGLGNGNGAGLEFKLEVVNDRGQTDLSDSFSYSLRVNQPPKLVIIKPEPSVQLIEPKVTIMEWTAEDDVGIISVNFHYQIRRDGKKLSSDQIAIPVGEVRSLINESFEIPFSKMKVTQKSEISYYLEARDSENLAGYSTTNQIRFFTPDVLYQKSIEEGNALEEQITEKKEVFENLTDQLDKLKILSEQEKISEENIKAFSDNLKEVYDSVQEDIEKVDQMESESSEENIISANLQSKLVELKKALESLDKNFLQRMQQNSESLLDKIAEDQMSQQDLQQFFENISAEKINQNVDQILNAVKNWRKLQKIDSLEKLANNLYLRYKDLESYIIAGLVRAEDVKTEGEDIAVQLEFIKSEFKGVQADFESVFSEEADLSEAGVKKIIGKLNKLLVQAKIDLYRQLFEKYESTKYLSERGIALDELRKGFFQLNNLNQDVDGKSLLSELNKQVFSISDRINWMDSFLRGGRYDLTSLSEEKKRSLLVLLISKQRSMLLEFKETLFLLSSSLLLELDFLDRYEAGLPMMEQIKKDIDPSSQIGKLNPIKIEDNVVKIKKYSGQLVRELIDLKEWVRLLLKESQKNRSLERAQQQQENLNQRISEMLNKKNLSEAEKEYLKQMALEQSYIKSLMEQAAKDQKSIEESREQSGSPNSGNNSPENQGGENRPNPLGEVRPGGSPQNQNNGENRDNPNGQSGQSEQQGESGEKRDGSSGEGGNRSGDEEENEDGVKELNEKYSERLTKLIDKMNQLESELAGGQVNLEKIKALQEEIEEELELTKAGLLPDDDRENLEKRKAEQAESEYEQRIGGVSEQDKGFVDKLNKLRIRRIDEEFRSRIDSFLRFRNSP